MAVYTIDPAGPRIGRVRIEAASAWLVDEWTVAWPMAVIGTPTQGWIANVEVLQDLGASVDLTSRQTRRVQPARALRVAVEYARQQKGALGATDLLGNEWQAVVDSAEKGTSRRSRLLVQAGMAAYYVAAIDAGDRTPVATVAKQLGLRQTQVRDRLYKARQVGLLEPRKAGRGRAHGTLTDAAIALLRREGSE